MITYFVKPNSECETRPRRDFWIWEQARPRPRRDWIVKLFRDRDRDYWLISKKTRPRPRLNMVQNFTRDRDETESLVYWSLETKTRPRLSPISGPSLLRGYMPYILGRGGRTISSNFREYRPFPEFLVAVKAFFITLGGGRDHEYVYKNRPKKVGNQIFYNWYLDSMTTNCL